ncbi:MAG: signal peptidase II, partial [Alphaproteobacteria bacterium]|nr:signal peptidase II [Alphaproteobacteria bacterium]
MKKILKILAIIFGVIAIDTISKGILLYLILGHNPIAGAAWDLVPNPYLMSYVTSFFNIVFTWNFGTAFSLFNGLGEYAPIILVIITGFVIGIILYYLFVRAKKYEAIPLSLIAGGALGNIIDRIRFGAVVDFLDFHIGGYHWPAFNVADICIVIGVGLYILNWYTARRKCLENVNKGGK